MSSTTMMTRFVAANYLLDEGRARCPTKACPSTSRPRDHLEQALAAAGRPWTSAATRAALTDLATSATAAPEGLGPASRPPTAPSAPCATCCSPAPTPTSADGCACDDFHDTARAFTRRSRSSAARPAAGAGLTLYGARAIPISRGSLEAAARAARPRPTHRCSSRCSCPAGWTCSTRSSPAAGRAATPTCAAAPRPEGELAPRGTPGMKLHPALAQGLGGGVAGLAQAGKVGFLPGIDYANPDLSHFHSRHFWETGLITPKSAPGWLGRWLDRPATPATRSQGISIGGGLSPVLRTRGAPGRRRQPARRRAGCTSAAPWGGDRRPARGRPRAALAADGRRGPGPEASPSAPRASSSEVADRLAPYVPARRAARSPASAIGYPARGEPARRPPAQPRRDALAAARHPRRGGPGRRRLRHPRQPAPRARPASARSPRRSPPSRPTSRRAALAQRVADARLVGVRPPPGGQRVGGTDHGAGGLAWVQGTASAAGCCSDTPRSALRRRRQPPGHGRLPPPLRVAARAVARRRRRRGAPQRARARARPARAMRLRRRDLVPLALACAALAGTYGASPATSSLPSAKTRARPRSASACASTASRCTAAASCRGACG